MAKLARGMVGEWVNTQGHHEGWPDVEERWQEALLRDYHRERLSEELIGCVKTGL